MNKPRFYTTRRAAVRAARRACCVALNAPHYEAAEGPDYEIHPGTPPGGHWLDDDMYFYRLRGPALDALHVAT